MTVATGTWLEIKRALLLLAIACTLALKLLVPTGYMPAPGTMSIELCTGMGVKTILIDADGKPVEPRDHHGAKATPCAYASMVAPVLSAVDPLLLGIVLALIVALGWRAQSGPPPVRRIAVRPPGQAPPRLILN